VTCSAQSSEWLNLLEEDLQLHELLTTRYTGCDSGATCLSGSIFPVITETAVISGAGAGGTISAQGAFVMVLCGLQEKEPPKACECMEYKRAKYDALVNTLSMDTKILVFFQFKFNKHLSFFWRFC